MSTIKIPNLRKFDVYSRFLKIKHKELRRLVTLAPEERYGSQAIMHKFWLHCQRSQRFLWFLVLKARQMGISTYSEGRIFHNTVTHNNTNSLILADNLKRSQYIYQMCKCFYDNLPDILRPQTKYSTKTELVFDTKDGQGLKSAIYVSTALDQYAGQGQTIHNVHVSEASSFPYLQEVFTSLLPSVPKTKDAIVIVETTAKGAGEHFHTEWGQAKSGSSIFNPLFLGWYLQYSLSMDSQEFDAFDPKSRYTKYERDMIKWASSYYKELMDYPIEIGDEQIAWRRWSIEMQFRGDEDGFNQEFPGNDDEAFIVAGNTEFSRKRLKEIHANTAKPTSRAEIVIDHVGNYELRGHLEERDDGRLWIWHEPVPGHIYRVSIDPAGGIDTVSKDNVAFQVLDVGEKEQVAEYQLKTDQIRAAHIGVVLARYYNDAKMVIELNYGFGTQNEAKRYYYNFYHHQHLDRITNTITNRIGFWSTWAYKKETIGYMHYAINEGLYKVNSERLSGEMNTFINTGGQELARAAPGCYDDLIMAWLICVYTAYQEREESDSQTYNDATESGMFAKLKAVGVQVGDGSTYKPDDETEHDDDWMDL